MLIGVPKEIKDNEFRVGMTPAVAAELIHHGHSVLVETSAGLGSGLTDDEYREAGATIVNDAERDLCARRDDREGQGAAGRRAQAAAAAARSLFTYLHLAPGPAADRGPDQVRRDLHRL